MDRATLHNIFSEAYNHENWLKILQTTFGAKQLYAYPKPILLPNNERAIGAFELGNFITSDDRIIGLYRVDVRPEVWLERNKISLRELLRNIYKYDVDGAVVVFVQDEKWRLSFVSDIKVINDKGEIVEQVTEPKRFTYLLGANEKVRTPSDRLSKLIDKTLSIQDILTAFSVEALNEEFYRIVQSFFYRLVGGKIGKGKKVTNYGGGILELPNLLKDNRQIYQEFAVRLIGRTVFCWFLKMKKSDNGRSLLPEHLLSSSAVQENINYYHNILERLFFQTLNTPMEERIDNLPNGADIIPFLNGGLFEPGNQDFYKPNSNTGLTDYFSSLNINDDWFFEFFLELEKYNFTIDENSVAEIEISVDPEMLGRIFENLLAEIDPDSGESARNATGSFYTPREIVDYMATESLVQYIHNKTTISSDKIWPIFKMLEQSDPEFSEVERERILDALDKVKILDPACGSGAFPMGVLQKIVQALQKLDPEAQWWKQRQIDRIKNPTVKKLLKEKLSSSGVEYARKIGIIQNSLYGVDIQPVAAEISKLRCFLSLVVDENIDESKSNRGIEPLPNLEFKFVTANTLINLPEKNVQRSMFDNFEELQELEELRNEYIQSYGKNKKSIKEKFLKVQHRIAKDQSSLFANQDSKAYKLGNWDPFGNVKSDWFDPKWMFGIETFDIVIGNPPYGVSIKGDYRSKVIECLGKVPDFEIYYYFIEKAYSILETNGILCYIIPNTFLFNTFAIEYRQRIIENWDVEEILDCTKFNIFQSATVRNTINLWLKNNESISKEIGYRKTKSINSFQELILRPRLFMESHELLLMNQNWSLAFMLDHEIIEIIAKIKADKKPLNYYYPQISQGLIAYDKYQGQPKHIIENRAFHYDSFEKDDLKKWLWGADVTKYNVKWNGKEYIDYCSGVANPRDPVFFKGERLLVREITNPSIFAGITNEELYNDPSIIIIKSNSNFSVKFIAGLLNSKLATFYHFNYSPKATKGAFPKILVKDIKEFPIVIPDNLQPFEVIIEYIIFLKSLDKADINHKLRITYFEQIIDGMIYELYFPKSLQDHKRTIIDNLGDLHTLEHEMDDLQREVIIEDIFKRLNEKTHPVRNNLFFMKNIEEIAFIEGLN